MKASSGFWSILRQQLVAELRLLRIHEEFYVSMEVNVGDEQMDSVGARSSETDRQDQRWSAYVTSSGRQDGDQARDVSAPILSHQLEGQELWTRTLQSTSFTREQEWSEQVPAAVRPLETEEWHVQPLQPLQILDAPRPENSVPDRLCDQLRWNERSSSQTINEQNRDWNQ